MLKFAHFRKYSDSYKNVMELLIKELGEMNPITIAVQTTLQSASKDVELARNEARANEKEAKAKEKELQAANEKLAKAEIISNNVIIRSFLEHAEDKFSSIHEVKMHPRTSLWREVFKKDEVLQEIFKRCPLSVDQRVEAMRQLCYKLSRKIHQATPDILTLKPSLPAPYFNETDECIVDGIKNYYEQQKIDIEVPMDAIGNGFKAAAKDIEEYLSKLLDWEDEEEKIKEVKQKKNN